MSIFNRGKQIKELQAAVAHVAPPRFAIEVWSDTECLHRSPVDDIYTIDLLQFENDERVRIVKY